MLDIQLLSLEIIHPIRSSRELVNDCYALWKNVWSRTFLELGEGAHVFSDDFTRQDEIVVLFYNNDPIALVMHRYLSTDSIAALDDSYFKVWPKEAVRKICKDSGTFVIGSNITIQPDYRKTAISGLEIKKIISYASLIHLKSKDISAITGTMRVDKGMNELFYSIGAIQLQSGVIFHGVPVDLVGFFPKEKEITIPADYQFLINNLFNKKRKKYADKYSRVS